MTPGVMAERFRARREVAHARKAAAREIEKALNAGQRVHRESEQLKRRWAAMGAAAGIGATVLVGELLRRLLT